jgi:hypothetical protein
MFLDLIESFGKFKIIMLKVALTILNLSRKEFYLHLGSNYQTEESKCPPCKKTNSVTDLKINQAVKFIDYRMTNNESSIGI